MSLRVTVDCDSCGTAIASAPAAEAARAEARERGGKSPLRGGLDLCAGCVKNGREPQGRHAETGPLSAARERLAG